MEKDPREGGLGEPGGEGEEGTRERGGKGGPGGGGGTGGEGGEGGEGQRGERGETGKKGGTSRLALIGYILMAVGVTIALMFTFRSDQAANDQRVDLCKNQHAIIEMQRLFLAEHAAIRVQLMEAGIPNQHADPELLERLAVLIEAADCDPKKI